MAKIGNLGKTIVFSTSDKKILTFDSFTQTVTGRWTTHERINKKPVSEFLGAGLRTVSFNITLNALHGVKPRATLKKIEDAIEKGTVDKLVIGGTAVGKNKWKITDISETWDIVMSKGELMQATASITLEEYL